MKPIDGSDGLASDPPSISLTQTTGNLNMADLYKLFKGATNLETEGVWFEIAEGVKFLMARAGGANKKYNRVFQSLMKPHMRAYRNGTLDDAVSNKIMRQAFAKGVLLDWEGVQDESGNTLEFSYDNAMKLFTDLPDLFDALFDEAGKLGNYTLKEMEDSGNA